MICRSRSEESGTLYEHCVRAIEHGLRFGVHGLPLIGSCDWNDGMNLVGKEGRGESIWLAFFFYDVLMRFAELARKRGEIAFADRCLAQARQLQENVEQHGWDGQWYRRAYFDSGEPLGSQSNLECQIDSLPQSWSVLSGAGNPERARQAMQAVEERLVRSEAKLIQLLDPPFDRSVPSPGYIQGYVPGIRENGGQYTHAAIWVVMARALLGDNDRAWELFALLNPDQSRVYRGPNQHLQSGTLCRCRRCLCSCATYRSGRLDLVHRISRMDVSAVNRNTIGVEVGGGSNAVSTPSSETLANV